MSDRTTRCEASLFARVILVCVFALLSACSVTDATKASTENPQGVASVELSLGRPTGESLSLLDTVTLVAVVRDGEGRVINDAAVSWGLTLERPLLPGEELGSIVQTGARTALLTVKAEYAIVTAGTRGAFSPVSIAGKFPVYAPRRWQGFIWTVADGFSKILAPNGVDVKPAAINDRGEVAGTVSSSVFGARAFIWSKNLGFTYLNGPDVQGKSNALGINASGVVTGWTDDGFTVHAFVWSRESGMQFVPGDSHASDFSKGVSINASGQIAIYTFAGRSSAGLRWSPPSSMDVLQVNADNPHSAAVAVNDAGDVLGYDGIWSGWDDTLGRRTPILWTAKGERIDIANCSRRCNMEVVSLNNRGEIAGTLDGSAFHRSANGEVFTIPMAPQTVARGMNDLGDIVVTSFNGGRSSWLWMADGQIVEIPLPRGIETLIALRINNKGQVLGTYR